MANPFDDDGGYDDGGGNPFDEPSEAEGNPFDSPAGGGGGADGNPFDGNDGYYDGYDANGVDGSGYYNGGSEGDYNSDLALKAEALRMKEEELNRLEENLEYRERVVGEAEEAAVGARPPNWPPCRPVMHHDIKGEIEQDAQGLQKKFYGYTYLVWFTYIFNAATMTIALFAGAASGLALVVSLGMVILGCPIFLYSVYMPLYKANRRGTKSPSRYFVIFFCVFVVFLGFAILWTVGLTGTGGAGLLAAIDMLGGVEVDDGSGGTEITGNSPFGAILAFVTTFLWLTCALAGIFLIKLVHARYRGRGHTLQQAANEGVTDFAQSDFGKQAIREGVKTSAQVAAEGARA